MMKKLLSLIAIVGLSVGIANADVVATGTNVNAETGNSTWKYLKITSGGSTSLYFYSSAIGDTYAIAFNAECSVAGLGNNDWANVDVLVNGVVQAPSTSDNAFCTDHNTNSYTNWDSGVTNVVFKSTKVGWNRVNVRVRSMVGTAKWRFDDKSLIVWN